MLFFNILDTFERIERVGGNLQGWSLDRFYLLDEF